MPLIVCLGAYLFIGLIMTMLALKDKRIADDVSHRSFIGQVTVLLVFTIISPIVFMLTFCKIFKGYAEVVLCQKELK